MRLFRISGHIHCSHAASPTDPEVLRNRLLALCPLQTCYGDVRYQDWEGLSVDLDERFRIVETLGDGKCLVMRNHGFLTVGATAGEAFMNT